MQDAYAHCAALVRTADKDRFLASLFAPARHRGALHALYAFNVEVARVREAAREPLPGEIRLQWWSEVLGGERSGEAAANPVAAALIDTIDRYKIPTAPLAGLVEAHRFDLYDAPMATVAALNSYAIETSSSLFAAAAQILGAGDDRGDITRPAGIATSIAMLMTMLPHHAARRQLFVPEDLLARHAVVTGEIFAGRISPALRAVVAELRVMGEAHLAVAGRGIVGAPSTLVPALLPLAIARLQFDRMKRAGDNPFASRRISPWRRQWAIWRAARDPARIAG
jgi:phytoene synthase